MILAIIINISIAIGSIGLQESTSHNIYKIVQIQVHAVAKQVHSRPIPYNRSLFVNCTEKVICLDYRDMIIISPLKRRLYASL